MVDVGVDVLVEVGVGVLVDVGVGVFVEPAVAVPVEVGVGVAVEGGGGARFIELYARSKGDPLQVVDTHSTLPPPAPRLRLE